MALTNPDHSSSTTQRISPKTVEKAVGSLLQWRNSKTENQKPQLLEQEDFVYLILTLKKIPAKGRTNPHKISLPHSLKSEFAELCLFIDDRPKSNLSKDDTKKKIQSENIPVSKIIKFSKLKTDYRPFESKRKLCDSYDMFFSDKRVIPLLPKLLGKHFYKKKKIPVPVDLTHKNWKEQIEKACGSALFYLKTGTCSVVKVARSSMEVDGIIENVLATIDGVAEIVPKKWANVRSVHLKLLDSVALPIYQAVPEIGLKIEGVKKSEEVIEEDGEGERKEKVDRKKGKKKKGRIHEVRYMDSNIGEVFDEDELGSDGDEEIGGVEDILDENLGSGKLESKKRNRGEKVKELGKKKKLKKSDSLKLEENVDPKNDELSAKRKKKKDANGIKKKKSGLADNGGDESAGKKESKSGIVKGKGGEKTKLKVKKSKKAAADE